MPRQTSRLGYSIISLGIVLQLTGLIAGSWGHTPSDATGGVLSFRQPGDVLLMLGMAFTVLGTVVGMVSTARAEPDTSPPRLLPLFPLVLLVGVSVGGASFAYQMGASSSTTVSQSAPLVVASATAPACPPGSFWHEPTQRCLSLQVDANGNPAVVTPVPAGATPVCPAGTAWHPVMKHCMPVSLLSQPCPGGFAWQDALAYCAPVLTTPTGPGPVPTQACPDGTFWHPVMNHCMSTVCPIGYEWNAIALICQQAVTPGLTSVPTATPTPLPGATQTSTPEATVAPTAVPTPTCPDGYRWMPAMGHCMSTTCPPGLVWNPVTWYCELPSATVSPTATPTLEVTATPTATPVSVPTPTCPDGYRWMPAMGHCMSTTCPPGLVWNPDTWYCELPTPLPSG